MGSKTNMDTLLDFLAAVITGSLASSGMWAFLSSRRNRKSATTTLLIGLAHDRIVHVGRSYISRGWITFDEYEDFIKYLYMPYSQFGGNGLAEKVCEEVKRLPIYSSTPDKEESREWKTLPPTEQ